MNRAWCWSCLVFLCVGNYGWAQVEAQIDAEEIHPVAVLAFSGYGEFKRNLEYLGKVSGSPDTATSLEQWLSRATQGQALASVEPDRPWGGYLTATENSQFWGVFFMPVSDIAKLVAAFSAIYGEPVDLGDNVYEFQLAKQHYFIAQKGNWAYWTQQKSALDALPRDPLSLLGDLNQKYDLAVRVNVRNIPQPLRDTTAAVIQQWLEAKLLRTSDEDNEQPSTLDAEIVRRKIEQLSASVNEFDQVTAGLKIDRAQNRTDLDVEITALSDSAAAKTFAAGLQRPKASQLSGVLASDAILSLHVNSPLAGDDHGQTGALLRRLADQALAKGGDEHEVTGNRMTKTRELVAKLFDLFGETTKKESRLNFGLIVTAVSSNDEFGDIIDNAIQEAFPNRVHETIIGAGQVTVVAAGQTADAARLEEMAMQIATQVARASGENQPKRNVDRYKGWRFHSLSVMAPQTMRADWQLRTTRNLLGNPIKIVLAFGDGTFYAALGEKGADAIKRVIDSSAEPPAEKLPPVTATIALSRAWKLLASQNGNRRAYALAETLKASGHDRITFTAEPVPNGVRYRLEGQEAFNMLLGGSLGVAVRALTTAAQGDRER